MNQPYQRVDDGVGAGLVGGAAVGAATVAAARLGLPKMNQTQYLKPTLAGKANSFLFGGEKIKGSQRIPFTNNGIGRRSGRTAAVGIIGGALLGGILDGANN